MAHSFASVSWVQSLLGNLKVRESVCDQHFKNFVADCSGHLKTEDLCELVRNMCEFLRIAEPEKDLVERGVAKFDVLHTGGLTRNEFRLFFDMFLRSALSEMEGNSDDAKEMFKGPATTKRLKVSTFDGPREFVLAARGDIPLILSVPHGGTWSPDYMPDQTGVTQNDHNTIPLAASTIEHIARLTGGHKPYSVVLGLHRRKLDANRDKGFQCPNQLAQHIWEQYHGAIKSAIDDCCLRFGGCHLVDIHGSGHYYRSAKPRKYIEYAEIGYGLNRRQLGLSDTSLDAIACTIKLGNGLHGVRTSEVVRGEHSLGAYLERAGLPGGAVPSNHPDRMCVPEDVSEFYAGGGPTVGGRHNKPDLVTTSQIEFPRGIRFSGPRSEFLHSYTGHLAQGLLDYVRHWFGPRLVRRFCVVTSPTALLHRGIGYNDNELCPMLSRGEVCRFVEEGEAINAETGVVTTRIRLVTPMCGWADKDPKLFDFEKGICKVIAGRVLLREEINLKSERLVDRLTRGMVCRWLAEGITADGKARVRVVAEHGSIVGWGNKELFEFI